MYVLGRISAILSSCQPETEQCNTTSITSPFTDHVVAVAVACANDVVDVDQTLKALDDFWHAAHFVQRLVIQQTLPGLPRPG